jgi:hypothetical protein
MSLACLIFLPLLSSFPLSASSLSFSFLSFHTAHESQGFPILFSFISWIPLKAFCESMKPCGHKDEDGITDIHEALVALMKFATHFCRCFSSASQTFHIEHLASIYVPSSLGFHPRNNKWRLSLAHDLNMYIQVTST